jgi:hypothetical protein
VDDRWIVVPSWERFQHYSDRSPPWIKLYTELNSKDEWLRLTDSQRGLLVTVWIEYARSRGVLSANVIPNVTRTKSVRRTLEALNHAGFIEFSASKPLAQRYHHTRSREKSLKRLPEKTRVRASDSQAARSHAPEENNAPEPPVDPDALAKLRSIQQLIGRPL